MINCQRPLVIYESMEVEFEHLNLTKPEVEFDSASFDVEGKTRRGDHELRIQR